MSLRSTSKLILQEAQLTYVVKDEVLQITTERAARGKMQCVVYAVADLLEGDLHYPDAPAETAKQSPGEALMRLITRTICPQEWSENGRAMHTGLPPAHPLPGGHAQPPTCRNKSWTCCRRCAALNDSDEEEERQGADPSGGLQDSC